jgi:hypothetical protein
VAYIGTQPVRGQYRKLSDISSGFNGSTTTFTTSVPPGTSNYYVTAGSASQLLVSLGGVIQQPDVDYTVNTYTITFTTAPAAGLSFFGVLMGDSLNSGSPADGSVTTSKLAGNLSVGLTGGSASTPSLYFTGDANTGIYSPGADTLAFVEGGVEAMRIDSSGRLGINIASPGALLDVSGSGNIVRFGDGTNTFDVRFKGPNNWAVQLDTSADKFNIQRNSSPLVTVDSSGRLLVNTSSARSNLFNTAIAAVFQVEGTTVNTLSSFVQNSNDAAPANLVLGKSKGTTAGSVTVVSSGDGIGRISFQGADGSELVEAAKIEAEVDGTPGANDMPGRLIFSTTADGASIPTERMRITNAGNVGIGTTSPESSFVVSNGGANGIEFGPVNGDIFTYNRSTSAYTNTLLTCNEFIVRTNGSNERARIDSSGRLLVGTSTYDGNGVAIIQGVAGDTTGPGVLDLRRGTTRPVGADTSIGYLRFMSTSQTSSNYHYAYIAAFTDGTSSSDTDIPGRLSFATTDDGASSPTERQRIGSNGQNSQFFSSTYGCVVYTSQAAGTSVYNIWSGYGASDAIGTGGTVSFRVSTNGNVQNTNNSYGAISDAKLKENIVDAGSQWDDLKAFQIRKFNFKEGQTHTQIGLIAQEAELVSPGLVSESPDRDAEGNDLGTVTKSVNYSVLYMKAVKALQEAMERIEVLEQRLADAGIA